VLPPSCPRSAGSSFTHSYKLDGNMIDTGNTAYNYVQQGSQDPHQNVRFDGTTGKRLCWLDINEFAGPHDPTGCLELGKYNIPPGSNSAPAGDQLTIATWMFQRSTQASLGGAQAGGARMMSKSESRTSENWLLMTQFSGNKNRLVFNINTGSRKSLTSDTTDVILLNTWYHVAGVYNGADMKIYINGEKVKTKYSVSGDLARDDTLRVTMGCLASPSSASSYDRRNFFDGKLAEMRVTNKALDATEIKYLYDQGVPNCDCHKTQSVDVNVKVHQKKGYGGGGGGYYYEGGRAYPSHSSKESVSSTRVKVSDLFSGAF